MTMDPITTILLTALGKLSNKAVEDAYITIKNYLATKLGKSNTVNQAIDNLEKESTEENEQRLALEIAKSDLQHDRDFQSLLKTLSEKAETNKIQVNISDNATVQGVIGSSNVSIGDLRFSKD